jgi:hypothetical protein
MEKNIQSYLSGELTRKEAKRFFHPPDAMEAEENPVRSCHAAGSAPTTNVCELRPAPLASVYQHIDTHGRTVFTNE